MAKRRDFLTASGFGAFLALPALAAGARLPDATRFPAGATLTREPFGELRIYFDGPTEQLKHVTAGSLLLKPGMEPHPPHYHPEEEFLLITEGAGEIFLEGTTTPVSPGAMMYCGANKLHGITNTGKTPLLFFFYKWRA
jgi:mannose-6-phosphate isomerase-like protein (cupin superfamily)